MAHRDVFVAIADPTRRSILDLLNGKATISAGDIAAHCKGVSRPAVSRHLRILRECGVVRARAQGKNKNYELNPAPLTEMRDGWLKEFAQQQTESLANLRSVVEKSS